MENIKRPKKASRNERSVQNNEYIQKNMQSQLNTIYDYLDKLNDSKDEEIITRLTNLENSVSNLRSSVTSLGNNVTSLGNRVTTTETNIEKLNGTVLYSGSAQISDGTSITLNSNLANYTKLKVYYRITDYTHTSGNNSNRFCVNIYNPNGNSTIISSPYYSGSTFTYTHTRDLIFSGNKIRSTYGHNDSSGGRNTSDIVYCYIDYVIGFE